MRVAGRFWILLPLLLCLSAPALAEGRSGVLARKRAAAYRYVIYLLPTGPDDLVEKTRQRVKERFKDLAVLDGASEEITRCGVYVMRIDREDFTPPDAEVLSFKGRGLGEEDVAKLQTSKQALLLAFESTAARVRDTLRSAGRLASEIAREHKGFIEDAETREVFTTAAWDEREKKGWIGTVPDVPRLVTIHAYRTMNGLNRAITLGMRKFGCPDVVAVDFSHSHMNPMGTLLNLTIQSLVERASLECRRLFPVDIRTLSNARLKKRIAATLEDGAERRAILTLGKAQPDEGDPDNELIAITFEGVAGTTLQERQDTLLSRLFGARDEIVYATHDEAIQAASDKACKRLRGQMKPRFLQGLPPKERLLVKGPFRTPRGGREWMWVEVTAWKGATIHGLLMNRPYHIPSLQAGSKVKLREDQVFDYLYYRADGSVEGNETGKLIQEAQRRK